MTPLLLLLLAVTPASGTERALVDRIVASVDRELVLASEIVLGRELAALDPGPTPFWSRAIDPMEQRVDATVLRIAASDIALYQPSTADVQARLETVRAAFVDRATWEAFLGRHGLDEGALSQELRRRMVVERFLLRNLTAPVDDRAAWFGQVDQLTSALRPRFRVRRIPQEPPPESGDGL
jgi:flagellar biosynthesis regulator FlaF